LDSASNVIRTERRRSFAYPFRYEIIDGVRGMAALVVVLHHLLVVKVGGYAVIIFFVISGYCIAAATESSRRRGSTFRSFMARRLRRIYPPYFFAVVFYVLTRVAKTVSTGHNALARPWTDWLQTLTLTQWVSLPFHPVGEAPQNPKLIVAAFWSLNYEEQFYLVMAIALALSIGRGVRIAWLILALGALGLLWNFAWPVGWITGFFLEYWAEFALGAMLFYVLCVYPSRGARIAFVLSAGVLALYCVYHLMPLHGESLPIGRAYGELAVASTFAVAMFFLRPLSAWIAQHWIWKPFAALGAVSYSLYLVHQFNLTLVEWTTNRIAGHAPELLRVCVMVVLHVTIATAFWDLCERPFLNKKPGSAANLLNAGEPPQRIRSQAVADGVNP
jgi:peptidoglycan/LPS O-acetylase OafA/YrhL